MPDPSEATTGGASSNPLPGAPERVPAGALEAEVLAVLWAADAAMTPQEVLDRLPRPLAYTTVMTTLSRLWRKGLARREQASRGFCYQASVSEADLAVQRMRQAMDIVSDSTAALAGFVDSLSRKEERALRRLLETQDPR